MDKLQAFGWGIIGFLSLAVVVACSWTPQQKQAAVAVSARICEFVAAKCGRPDVEEVCRWVDKNQDMAGLILSNQACPVDLPDGGKR